MQERPHILLITADELRKDSLGCYGNQSVETPNLDRLAGEGILFDRAYTVSPWCLPARCSILTGMFPHNSGAFSNFRKCALDNGIPNLFTELKKAGYTTSLFGKCHFAPVPYDDPEPEKTLPYEEFRDYYASLGIDHLELQDGKSVSIWYYDDYSKELEKAGYLKAYREETWRYPVHSSVFPFPAPPEWHPDSWVGRKATEYLKNYDGEQPLFSWVSFSGPHYSFDAPEEYLDRVDTGKIPGRIFDEKEFDDPARLHYADWHGEGTIDGCWRAKDRACKNYTDEYWDRLRKSYLANVSLIDDQVGMIIDTAKKKFGENILIIFTTDHGEMLGNHGIWGKNNCGYEDVWNIPMIVRYPYERKGVHTGAMVMLTDIMPTCLKAAGTGPMECDGKDFRENTAQGGYTYVFAEGEGYIAVSDGTVKYIHVQKGGMEFRELTDLSADPHEFVSHIDNPAYSGKLAELSGKIIELFMGKLLP